MPAKKNPLDALKEISEQYDIIKGMNPHKTTEQILEIVSKATGQTLANVKKRWKIITGVEWPVIDYIERGVIGMNRATLLVDNDLSPEDRQKMLDESLDEKVTDSQFKEWVAKYLEKLEKSAS